MKAQTAHGVRWMGGRLNPFRHTAAFPGKQGGFSGDEELSLTGPQRVLWCLGLLCAFAIWRIGAGGIHTLGWPGVSGHAAEAAPADEPLERAYYGRRLEPREPVILQGSGPVSEARPTAYGNVLSLNRPMLTATFVNLHDDLPLFFANLRSDLAHSEQADAGHGLLIPQIGIALGAARESDRPAMQIGLRVDDKDVSALVAGLRALDRPVFLRIGYAFNEAANGYEPRAYVSAYRRIAEGVRSAGLQQVALVWDWSPDAELDMQESGARERDAVERWQVFYPGDDVVDWWGLTLLSEPGIVSATTTQFLAAAEHRRYPVIIGEATPKGHDTSEGSLLTESWFRPYFHLIHASPAVKAACYFDRDWRAYPQWSTWGDGRIEADPVVLNFTRAEMSRPLYAGLRNRRATETLLELN